MDNVNIITKQLKESGASVVSIIAVMGSYRTGKSFLLDLLMRHLRHKAAKEVEQEAKRAETVAASSEAQEGAASTSEADPEKVGETGARTGDTDFAPETGQPAAEEEPPWRFDEDAKTLQTLPAWVLEGGDAQRISEGSKGGLEEGFAWRPGQEKCTEGIWLWSTPFVFRDPSGRKVAVLLMDTQGAFDDTITKAQSSTIFGLTALLSAKLIYNIQNNLQEDRIDNLDYITTYAQTACSSIESTNAPFGHLEFLVRDWPNYENGFDIDACRGQMGEHLDSHLNPDKVSEDARPRVERLKNAFKSIKCSGLPHPGVKVTRPAYAGEINTIDPNFFKLLDDFTGRFFGGDFPEPSAPLGHEITVDTFERILINFAEVFRDHADMAIGLREAFVKVELISTRDELLKRFKAQMQRIAPDSSVVDPVVLEEKTAAIVQDIETEFKMKLKPWKMKYSEEQECVEDIMRTMDEAVRIRTLQNTKEVEGATVKLVASPVVGMGAYFLFCHHFILVIVAGAGGYFHVRKFQVQETARRGSAVSPVDTKVMEGVATDIKKWSEQRWRDVQAIQVALKRFNPSDAMEQLTHATNQARTLAISAAAGGVASSGPSGAAYAGQAPPTGTTLLTNER